MNNKIAYILCFIFGTVSGVLATNYLLKEKYEKILQEEVNSVKKIYLKKNQKFECATDETNEEPKEENSLIESSTIIKPTNKKLADYIDYTKKYSTETVSGSAKNDEFMNYDESEYSDECKHDTSKPYVISPDSFGEISGYSLISLSYYSDGVLADENDEPVENIADTVGIDFDSHFGEYEDDSVFIRNDPKWCDYEISKDARKYSNIVENDSSFVGEET